MMSLIDTLRHSPGIVIISSCFTYCRNMVFPRARWKTIGTLIWILNSTPETSSGPYHKRKLERTGIQAFLGSFRRRRSRLRTHPVGWVRIKEEIAELEDKGVIGDLGYDWAGPMPEYLVKRL
jgi:hypothetical protein